MTYTPDSVVIDVDPDIGAAQFDRILHDADSPAKDEALESFGVVAAQRVSTAFALAIFNHESRMGHAGLVPEHDLKNPGATRSTRTGVGEAVQIPGRGPFVRYPNWTEGWRDLAFRLVDPSFVYHQEGRRTVRQIIERWAPASDGNAPPSYINAVLRDMNEWVSEEEEPPVSLTETIRDRIAAHGVEVHDIRGQMVRHPALRYERLPHVAWLYTGVHHTAVSRGKRSLQGDIDSWRNHSAFHVNTRGWPGIAYAIGLSQSGRVFMLRDVEEMGYHAFTANANTLAVCGDLGETNEPTEAILASLGVVLGVLHDESPEFMAMIGRTGTYGHDELSFIDSRNDTACPGNLLPFVRAYREGATSPDDALHIAGNPFGEVPIVMGFRGLFESVGKAKWPADPIAGGLSVFGYAKEPEQATDYGAKQEFERGTMRYERDASPPFDLVLELRD